MMKKHFVTFYRPGTFVAETVVREVDGWNLDEARNAYDNLDDFMRTNCYGFQFFTKGRADDELDSKVTDRSAMYYLGGKVETYEDVQSRTNGYSTLLSNMKSNGYDRVITNVPSGWTQPLRDDDVVLPVNEWVT